MDRGRRLAVGRAAFVAVLLCAVFAQQVEASVINAASVSYADVSAAYAVAVSGDEIHIPAGTADWGTDFLLVRIPVTIQGAGRDNTIIRSSLYLNSSGQLFTNGGTFFLHPLAESQSGTYSILGITFDGKDAGGLGGAIAMYEGWNQHLVVGWCRFKNYTDSTTGVHAYKQQIRGGVFHNEFVDCNYPIRLFGYNDLANEWTLGDAQYPYSPGSTNDMFFENNSMSWTGSHDGGLFPPAGTGVFANGGWIEIGQSMRIVIRYNDWNFANTTATNWDIIDIHGFQSWIISGSTQAQDGQTGSKGAEVYGNTVENFPGLRWWVFRGGIGRMFNNIATGSTNSGQTKIVMQQYGYGDEAGAQSGCMASIVASGAPGAPGTVFNGEVKETAGWNNLVNGSEKLMENSQNGCPPGTDQNVGWRTYNASFDGTAGVGRGTATPTMSCTTGALYWKASTVTPTTDVSVTEGGTLYQCSAPNTWTVYYQPAAHPNPYYVADPSAGPTPTPSPSHNGFFGLP